MSDAAAATRDLDARALALFDEWLTQAGPARTAALAALSRSEPVLHARVLRMLATASDANSSRAAQAPALDALSAAAAGGLQAGDLIAGWRLKRELGRGGMSVVWLAEPADGRLKRDVALKLPLQAHLSQRLAERFARERDVLAALNHPHIAQLYDAGVSASGRPFVVLEHVPGQTITAYAAAHGLDMPSRLRLFLQVLDAVEHAHRHMIVHRDLKPGNILVTTAGDVKLLDFGIAKLLEPPPDASALTQDLAAVMTPSYAAPEQVAGRPITTQTDVHGAGVVLYELLTGRLPRGNVDLTAWPMAQAVLNDDAAPPGLGPDLDTVVLKALAHEPERRYASIERLAEDLRRVLAHQPILARRVPWWQRAVLLARRHPRALAVSAVGALVVGLSSGLALQRHLSSLDQERRAATVQRFLVSMLADAEPDEARPDTEVSARSMVDAALARARAEHAQDALVLGPLLSEIGRVYARLGLILQATAALEEAVDLLAPRVPPDDPTLHQAQAFLAAALGPEQPQRAKALAQAVIAGCSNPVKECAQARSLALTELARLLGVAGNDQASLEAARAAVQEARVGFGPATEDAAAALGELAVMARNMGRLTEAAAAIDEAADIGAKHTLRASHRATLLRTQAVLDHDLGRHLVARDRLLALLRMPAPAWERIVHWRLLAQVHWSLGAFESAEQAAAQARDLARAADDSLEWVLAQLWHARVQATRGQATAALAEIAAAERTLLSLGHASDSIVLRRLHRFAAEAELLSGHAPAALQRLAPVLQQHAQAGSPHLLEHAEALDLAGSAALAAGEADRARQHHGAAAALWGRALPDEHPLRLRHAVYAAAAGADPAAARVQHLVQRYAASKPEASDWHRILKKWQEAPSSAPKGGPGALVLG